MLYREKILELIFDANPHALFDWIYTHPQWERVDILKEFQTLVPELLRFADEEGKRKVLQQLSEQIEQYEDAILDANLASLKMELAEKQLEKADQEMSEAYDNLREQLRAAIEGNEPNAADAIKFVREIIAIEKQHNLYDPIYWHWFQEYDK
jgi:predicted  nucleic acid-binding Zn-ribbon protein